MTGSATVLDASALLAHLQGEPGAAEIAPLIEHGRVSAVNWSEVVQTSLVRGVAVDRVERRLLALGLVIDPFTADDAAMAAELWSNTRVAGLSLAGLAGVTVGVIR